MVNGETQEQLQQRLIETEVNRRVENQIIQMVRGQSSPPINQAGLIQGVQRTKFSLQRSGQLDILREQARQEILSDIQSGQLTDLTPRGSSLSPTQEQQQRTLSQQRQAEQQGRITQARSREQIFGEPTAVGIAGPGQLSRGITSPQLQTAFQQEGYTISLFYSY